MTKLKEYLEKLAAQEAIEDTLDPMDPYDFGGNMDDAFEGGFEEGQTLLARSLLERFFDES